MTDKSFLPTTKLFLGLLSTSERSKTLLDLSALNLLRSKCFMTLDELLALLCVHVELTAAVISVRAISISKLLQQYYGENVQRFSTEMIKVNFTSFHPKNLDDRFDPTDARCSWNQSLSFLMIYSIFRIIFIFIITTI